MFYYLWDVPIFMGMGAVGGLMGAGFCHFNVKVTQFRHKCVCPHRIERCCSKSKILSFFCCGLLRG